MGAAYQDIELDVSDSVARIRLNRPDALNAWTPDLGRELHHAIGFAASSAEVRSVLLTGAGRAFSSGADLRSPRELTPDGDPDLRTRLLAIYNPIVLDLRRAPKPVLAAVNGPAAGLGFALALACDLVVAAESAYFLLPFVNIGLMPEAGAMFLAARRVGYARAAQLAMLGERLGAREALEWGLINEVVPDERLLERGQELAARLAAGPTIALGNMKRALSAGAHAGLAEQLELEASLQQDHATSDDYVEGVTAFMEKRSPGFRGC